MKTHRIAAIVAPMLAALTLAGCGSSSGADAPTPRQQLQQALDDAVGKGLPAVGLAIQGDAFEFVGAAGVEDRHTQVPVTRSSRFYLASVGKTYTAVALLRLASAGALDLDDAIGVWLPSGITDLIPAAERITVRRLLNHTSGLFDFQNDGDDWNRAFQEDSGRQWSNADTLPYFLGRPLHFEPGTDYRYSNSNYVLAALVAEAAAGMRMRDIVRYYLIEPAGLMETLHGDEAGGVPGLVHGYIVDEEETVDVYPWYSHFAVADGGIQSSMRDVVRFVRTVMTSDLLIDESTRAEFVAPSGSGQPPSNYGLGIQAVAGDGPGEFVYGHSGKDPGYQADFIHVQSGSGSLTLAIAASGSFDTFDGAYQGLLQTVLDILGHAEAGL